MSVLADFYSAREARRAANREYQNLRKTIDIYLKKTLEDYDRPMSDIELSEKTGVHISDIKFFLRRQMVDSKRVTRTYVLVNEDGTMSRTNKIEKEVIERYYHA